MANPNRQEFPLRIPVLARVAPVLGAACQAFLAVAAGSITWRGWKLVTTAGPSATAAEMRGLWAGLGASAFTALFFCAAALLLAYAAVRIAREGRTGSIALDEDGVKVTDWRGQEKCVRWADIQEMRVVTCGGAVQAGPDCSAC